MIIQNKWKMQFKNNMSFFKLSLPILISQWGYCAHQDISAYNMILLISNDIWYQLDKRTIFPNLDKFTQFSNKSQNLLITIQLKLNNQNTYSKLYTSPTFIFIMKVSLLLLFLLPLIQSINKYHRRIPIICKRQFCLALLPFERLTYPKDVSIVPTLITQKPLEFIPYNHNFLFYKKLAEGSSAEVFVVQDYETEELKILKRYFETEDKTNFQEQNYIMHKMKYDMKWSLSPKWNQTISIHRYAKVKHLTDVKLSSRDLKVIMYKLIKQVDKAHQNGIIHSDLKPQNALIDAVLIGQNYVTQKMRVTLIDWNLAAFYNIGCHYKRASGTSPLKSPQMVIQSQYYTPVTDVWSLGITMYEALVNETLIPSDHDTQVYQMIKVFGFQKFKKFYDKINVKTEPLILQQIIAAKGHRSKFQEKIQSKKINNEERQFIKRMLTIQPWDRPSCRQLLEDRYFDDLRGFQLPMSYKSKQKVQRENQQFEKKKQQNAKKEQQLNKKKQRHLQIINRIQF